MNKHFSDARYYLGRAASHLKLGLGEELTPVVRRVRARFGDEVEAEPEPETRTGRVRVAAKQGFQRVRQARQPDEQTA
jgi:hypothetical protein